MAVAPAMSADATVQAAITPAFLQPSPGPLTARAAQASQPTPAKTSVLHALVCISAADCWPVSAFGNSAGDLNNETLRLNGKSWSHVSTPNPGGTAADAVSTLNGVTCRSACCCWAVGGFNNRAGGDLNHVLRWNGKKCSRVSTPNPGGTARHDENALSTQSPACEHRTAGPSAMFGTAHMYT